MADNILFQFCLKSSISIRLIIKVINTRNKSYPSLLICIGLFIMSSGCNDAYKSNATCNLPKKDRKYEKGEKNRKEGQKVEEKEESKSDGKEVIKHVKLYNNLKLVVNRSNTLVICDWDDTLFPTSWINDENIDLTNIRARYEHTRYFDILDKYLYETIKLIKKHADLMIVTNATRQWVMITLTVLPKTRKLLMNTPIISARESFQNQCGIKDWKKHTFRAELEKEGKTHYNNIISFGDANYEHEALVSLYKWDIIPHKYLKSVKFTRSNNYFDLLNQIRLIGIEGKNIINAQRHLDLTLDIVK